MKKLILLLALIPILLSGQEIFQKEITFSKNIGINSMVKLSDDGFLACGSVSNASLDSSQAIIIRFDSLMQVSWCKSYTMQAKDYFTTIAAMNDGNYIVGGSSKQEFTNYQGSTLFKVDDSGNVIWHKLFSKNYDDVSWGVYEQPDQSIAIIVRHGVTGQPAKILKTDGAGNLMNEYTIETTNVTSGVVPDCVTSDNMGNYYLGGTALNSNTGKYMYFIAKVNDSNLLWYQEYDLDRNTAYLYGITILTDGNIGATGNMTSETNPNGYSLGVLKVDAGNGSVIWIKEIKQASDYNVAGYAIFSLSNNNMMVLGRANTLTTIQGYAVKLDAGGNVLWAREYGDGPYESMSFAMEVSGSRYLLMGRMALDGFPYVVQSDHDGWTPCLNTLLDFTAFDITATLYSPQTIPGDPEVEETSLPLDEAVLNLGENVICSGTVGTAEFKEHNSFSVYPNPADDLITVQFEGEFSNENLIDIYSVSGELLYTQRMAHSSVSIRPGFLSGIYFLSVYNRRTGLSHQQKLIFR